MQMRSLPRGKNIVAAGYDAVTGTLRTRFNKSGEYEYSGVPEDKFISLFRVPFPDSYFTKAIKGKFTIRKIEVEDVRVQDGTSIGAHQPARSHSNSGSDGDASRSTGAGGWEPRPAHGETLLRDSRCDAGSTESERMMEVYFPQDGMEFHEKDDKGNPAHYYTLKGERVPFSLTQVLQLAGLAREPQSAKEAEAWAAKAVLGTKVHDYTLWLEENELDLADLVNYPAYHNRVLGWKQFCEDMHFQSDLTSCEVPIGLRVNGCLFAMKVDRYGVIGEGDGLAMAVVEIKTTVSKEPSHAIQTAAQAIAFRNHAESVNMPIKRMAVYLSETPNQAGRYYSVEPHENRMDEKIFLASLATVYWRLNNGLLKAGI